MRYVVTAEQMRALDRATIQDVGLPGVVLMENAGRAVARRARRLLATRPAQAPEVAVLCGAGNNGGDGFVAARVLMEEGVSVAVYLAAPAAAIRGDAKAHLDVYRRVGGRLCSIENSQAVAEHADAIARAHVLVDCLFGTGLTRPVTGHYREIIEAINRAPGAVLAVDLPSGLAADTGQVLGVAVAADATVTMAFLKVALVVAPGFARCGEVEVAEIGIPGHLARQANIQLALLDEHDLVGLVPRLSPLDYKTSRGHLLVVAGSPGKRGAARLAAWGALRVGAGLVTLAAAGTELAAPDPVMTAELDAEAAGAGDRLRALAAGKRAVAIGPGMSTGGGGRALVYAALQAMDMPLLLDADALNHLAGDLGAVARAAGAVVLTPHPGEAARLLRCTTAEVEADRVGAVRALARQSGAVVVLKGARTLVCDGSAASEFVTVNPTGHAALATAGTGDVLTGVIAGLLAQGAEPKGAALLGVFLHGRAAELAADSLGAASVTASDVADWIPLALRRMP